MNNNVITAEPAPEKRDNILESKQAMAQVLEDTNTLVNYGIPLTEAVNEVYEKYKEKEGFFSDASKLLVDYLQREVEVANSQQQLDKVWAEIEQLDPGVYSDIFKKPKEEVEKKNYLVH